MHFVLNVHKWLDSGICRNRLEKEALANICEPCEATANIWEYMGVLRICWFPVCAPY